MIIILITTHPYLNMIDQKHGLLERLCSNRPIMIWKKSFCFDLHPSMISISNRETDSHDSEVNCQYTVCRLKWLIRLIKIQGIFKKKSLSNLSCSVLDELFQKQTFVVSECWWMCMPVFWFWYWLEHMSFYWRVSVMSEYHGAVRNWSRWSHHKK